MTDPEAEALASPFIRAVILQIRAQDTHGAWEGRNDMDLLTDFIVTREQRRQIPIIGDPDPDILWRLETFYRAVGLSIEKEAGVIASPMMAMSHEGFGRMILTAGRLVVISRHLRDVHRFGFETVAAMAEQGVKLVSEGVAMIRRFPEVVTA
ncbi:MAG: NifX-associated nitrogen fixation protein [Alphaproteobacteria bacterium]